MHVTQGEHGNPKIDYQTWARLEKEREEAKDLDRLRRRYLKSTSEKETDTAKDNLTVFYEKVFEGYTSE